MLTADLAVAFRRDDDTTHCQDINAAIQEMKGDGTIDAIYETYTAHLSDGEEAAHVHLIKRAASRWLQLAVGVFLVVSIFVFVAVGVMVQYQDLAETYKMAEETTAFVQAECKKFDNYTRGSSARALQDLLDKADGLKKFISPQQLADPAFLQEFIYTEHVGGIVILDQDLQPIAQADMDHQNTLSLWTETTAKKNMQDILAHP